MALLTTNAEYMAACILHHTMKKIAWMKALLLIPGQKAAGRWKRPNNIVYGQSEHDEPYKDPVFHKRIKHIDM